MSELSLEEENRFIIIISVSKLFKRGELSVPMKFSFNLEHFISLPILIYSMIRERHAHNDLIRVISKFAS